MVDKNFGKTAAILAAALVLGCVIPLEFLFVENSKAEAYDEEIQNNSAKDIYVSPNGSQSGDGSFNNPFREIESAVEKADELRNSISSLQEINVILRGGEYRINKTINLNKTGSAANDAAKLVIRAYEGEEPVLKGSQELDVSQFTQVSDEDILKRVADSAKDKIVCMSVAGLGVADKNPEIPSSYIKIYNNDKEQTIAQWPNGEHNYAVFSPVSEGGIGNAQGGSFKYLDTDRPDNWSDPEDAVAVGYFGYDYRQEAISISEIDTEKSIIKLAHGSDFGINSKQSRRWKAYNILEELDRPGEWYIDRDAQMLYYYPAEDCGKVEIGVFSDNMFDITGASNITFSGLTFKNTSGGVIHCYHDKNRKSENITIEKCTFENIGGHAINMYTYQFADFYDINQWSNIVGNLYNVEIANNIFYNTYQTPITVHSGDFENFTGHGVKIYNNYANQTAPFSLSGYLLGSVNAVEGEIRNNLAHNAPYHVLGATGLRNKIMYNETVSAVRETVDAGAFYVGRTVMHRDNEYGYNFFYKTNPVQDILKPYTHNRAIYFDDGYSNGIVHHNISVDGDKSFYTSGSGNKYNSNISVDCPNGIEISVLAGADRYSSLIAKKELKSDENPNGAESDEIKNKVIKFLTEFPEIENEYDVISQSGFAVTSGNEAEGNLTVNGTNPETGMSTAMLAANRIEDNINLSGYNMFVNPEELDFRVKKTSEAYMLNPDLISEDFDLSDIGLQQDQGFDLSRITEKRSFSKLYPAKGETVVAEEGVEFMWERSFDADSYRIIIAEDSDFKDIIVDEIVPYNHYTMKSDDSISGYYFWRVYAVNETRSMSGEWESEEGKTGFYITQKTSPIPIDIEMVDKNAIIEFSQPMYNYALNDIAVKDGDIEIDVKKYLDNTDDRRIIIDFSGVEYKEGKTYTIETGTELMSVYGQKIFMPYVFKVTVAEGVYSIEAVEDILTVKEINVNQVKNNIQIVFSGHISQQSLDSIKVTLGGTEQECGKEYDKLNPCVIYLNTENLKIENKKLYYIEIPDTVTTDFNTAIDRAYKYTFRKSGVEYDFNANGMSTRKWRFDNGANRNSDAYIYDNRLFLSDINPNDTDNRYNGIPYSNGSVFVKPEEFRNIEMENSIIEFDYVNYGRGFGNGNYVNMRVFMRAEDVNNSSDALQSSISTANGAYILEISQYGKEIDIRKCTGGTVSFGALQGNVGTTLSEKRTLEGYEVGDKVRFRITLNNEEDNNAAELVVYAALYNETGELGKYKQVASAKDTQNPLLNGGVYFSVNPSNGVKYYYINSHAIDNFSFYTTALESSSEDDMFVTEMLSCDEKISLIFSSGIDENTLNAVSVKNTVTGEMYIISPEVNIYNSKQLDISFDFIDKNYENYELKISKDLKSVFGKPLFNEYNAKINVTGMYSYIDTNVQNCSNWYVKRAGYSESNAYTNDGWIYLAPYSFDHKYFEEKTPYSDGALVNEKNYDEYDYADSILEFDYKNLNTSSVKGNGNYSGMRIFIRSGEFDTVFSDGYNKISSSKGAYIITLYPSSDKLYAGLRKWDGSEINIAERVDLGGTVLISEKAVNEWRAEDEYRYKIKTTNVQDGVLIELYMTEYIDGKEGNYKKVLEYTDNDNPYISGTFFFTACGSSASYINGYISSHFIKDISYITAPETEKIENVCLTDSLFINDNNEIITDLTGYKNMEIGFIQGISSNLSRSEKANLMLALYNKEEALIQIVSKPVTLAADAKIEEDITFRVSENIGNNYITKVFIWNNEMVPLGKAK